jgi:hypothetical protein
MTSSVESYQFIFSAYDGKQNHRIGDVVEQEELFFRKVAYARYDVASKVFPHNCQYYKSVYWKKKIRNELFHYIFFDVEL